MLPAVTTHLRRATTRALAVLFPPRCPGCGCVTTDAEFACPRCRSAVFRLTGPGCPRCGQPRQQTRGAADDGGDAVCGRCTLSPPAFDRAISLWAYDGVVAEAIQQLKYGRRLWIARRLGRALRPFLARTVAGLDVPLVTSVPMHPADLRRRGFDAAHLVLREALPSNISRRDVLTKTRHTPPQAGLSAAERRANLKSAFAADPSAVSGRHLVVFDDVLTTGATAHACARALRQAGAASVTVCTAARAIPSAAL